MTEQPLHHVEFGAGTPVLLLHGYTIDHRLLLPLEPVFAERGGWRRLYADLPGSGRSPRLSGPVTAEAMGEAVLRFVDKVIGDEPFAVVGISYGGQLARHVVAERGAQVLGTALLAPLVKPSGERVLPRREVLTRDEALLASLDPADREVFASIAVHQDEAGWQAFRDHVLPGIRAHHREDAAALLKAYMLTETPEARFGTHAGPHLLVTGRQDHLVGWRDQWELLEHYPRMTYAAVDGAGHNVHLDRPSVVQALLGNWLDTLTADARNPVNLFTKPAITAYEKG
ncbi:alpha/beta fold hydrolase [Streptomyces sp. MBT33]|uniref:alpha/beta fold hydrolase n=1 Tax=Streptomyces sp. MBT33 TaxID=1488363 RepID=UPI001909D3EA|nr:alpha/beta hydrolase [Streptomyces sp. MBT33]MBK3646277.1 alpha/beta hydrolase [Streptomyces sp. MBT33]